MILIIDNYDSFVYNLALYVTECGHETLVRRNDDITIAEIVTLNPDAIILSPGPCTPEDAGICIETIQKLGAHTPILGVCLGHQAIGEAYGGRTIRSPRPMHGRASTIIHNSAGLFSGLPENIDVGRYHSLCIALPEKTPLKITARTLDTGDIMAVEHELFPVFGVQFHPESILTPHGKDIIMNFLEQTVQRGTKAPLTKETRSA